MSTSSDLNKYVIVVTTFVCYVTLKFPEKQNQLSTRLNILLRLQNKVLNLTPAVTWSKWESWVTMLQLEIIWKHGVRTTVIKLWNSDLAIQLFHFHKPNWHSANHPLLPMSHFSIFKSYLLIEWCRRKNKYVSWKLVNPFNFHMKQHFVLKKEKNPTEKYI